MDHSKIWTKEKVLFFSPNWEPVWLCGLHETNTSESYEGRLLQTERFYCGREEWEKEYCFFLNVKNNF